MSRAIEATRSTTRAFPTVQRQCWCGAERARGIGVFDLPDGTSFPLAVCEGCGVQVIHPQPNDAELGRYYSAEYYGSSRRKFIWPVATVFDFLQGARTRAATKRIGKGGRVLDVGCGNGVFLMQMKRRGYLVEGTEWSAQSAARVPAGSGIAVHVGDLIDLELPVHSYDLVSMWHVLEHVRDPYESLVKIRTLLKRDGWLSLALPNVESPQARRFGTAWLHYDPPRHLCNFGIESLRKLLQLTGFEVLAINTHALDQNTFGYVQSWLNTRGYPRDRLYGMLKGIAAQEPLSDKAVDATWLGLLTIPAAVISSVEAMRGQGATMVVWARPAKG